MRLDTFASSVSAAGVHLKDGELVAGDTVLGTIGTSSNPLLERIGVRCLQGRIVVNGDMSVPGLPGVWAMGDCAAVPNALDGSISPPTAQFAVRQAKHLAGNLVREMRGRATEPFRYRSRGAMASIGHLKGVAEVFGVPLTGWLAWLVWRAYYLSQMPSSGRRLRIFFEWSWGMFFPSDITHLRFTRSAEVHSEDERRHAEQDAALRASAGSS